MGHQDFDIISCSSFRELEQGDSAMPCLDEYWMAPITRLVIAGAGQQIAELPTKPSSVAARDSHRIGA